MLKILTGNIFLFISLNVFAQTNLVCQSKMVGEVNALELVDIFKNRVQRNALRVSKIYLNEFSSFTPVLNQAFLQSFQDLTVQHNQKRSFILSQVQKPGTEYFQAFVEIALDYFVLSKEFSDFFKIKPEVLRDKNLQGLKFIIAHQLKLTRPDKFKKLVKKGPLYLPRLVLHYDHLTAQNSFELYRGIKTFSYLDKYMLARAWGPAALEYFLRKYGARLNSEQIEIIIQSPPFRKLSTQAQEYLREKKEILDDLKSILERDVSEQLLENVGDKKSGSELQKMEAAKKQLYFNQDETLIYLTVKTLLPKRTPVLRRKKSYSVDEVEKIVAHIKEVFEHNQYSVNTQKKVKDYISKIIDNNLGEDKNDFTVSQLKRLVAQKWTYKPSNETLSNDTVHRQMFLGMANELNALDSSLTEISASGFDLAYISQSIRTIGTSIYLMSEDMSKAEQSMALYSFFTKAEGFTSVKEALKFLEEFKKMSFKQRLKKVFMLCNEYALFSANKFYEVSPSDLFKFAFHTLDKLSKKQVVETYGLSNKAKSLMNKINDSGYRQFSYDAIDSFVLPNFAAMEDKKTLIDFLTFNKEELSDFQKEYLYEIYFSRLSADQIKDIQADLRLVGLDLDPIAFQ